MRLSKAVLVPTISGLILMLPSLFSYWNFEIMLINNDYECVLFQEMEGTAVGARQE